MTTTNNTVLAKAAALAAGIGLVLTSMVAFSPAQAQTTTSAQLQAQIQALLAQIAALQAQLNGNTNATACTFTRDLTIGSQGQDVTCLQTYLTTTGHFTFSGGATGYFGPITQTAVARWQAANGIAPAAGYFGSISRSAYARLAPVTPTPTVPDNDNDDDDGDMLSGGEADLNEFDLRSEEGDGAEGETDVEIATAEFDVDDGDARIERMEVTFGATSGSYEEEPWDYFDTLYILDEDGDELDSVDAGDRDEWDETDDDVYSITFTGLSHVVREGDTAMLTLAADIQGNIDTSDLSQTFSVFVPDRGIRAVDSEGIQNYIGDEDDSVTFGFTEERTGDLTIRESDEDPNASILIADDTDVSDEFTVFAFELENEEDVDTIITDLTIDVDTDGGANADDIIRTATLMIDGDDFRGDVEASSITFDDIDFEIGGDDMATAELMIELSGQSGRYDVGQTLQFSVDSADFEAEGVDSGDESDVEGSATGSVHTIALTGAAVMAESASVSNVVTPGNDASASYATYTIRFEVAALEDDIYVPNTTSTTSASAGVLYSTDGANTFSGTASAVLSSNASSGAGYYRVSEGTTRDFTLTVTLNPDAAGSYQVALEALRFSTTSALTNLTTFTVDDDEREFETNPVFIPN